MKRYVLIRTQSAGVFAGYLKEWDRAHRVAVLTKSIRIWQWAGAASLSELSQSGTISPNECRFPEPMLLHEVCEVVEVIDCTDQGRKSIQSVPAWSAAPTPKKRKPKSSRS